MNHIPSQKRARQWPNKGKITKCYKFTEKLISPFYLRKLQENSRHFVRQENENVTQPLQSVTVLCQAPVELLNVSPVPCLSVSTAHDFQGAREVLDRDGFLFLTTSKPSTI
jgi:hypothetical protein